MFVYNLVFIFFAFFASAQESGSASAPQIVVELGQGRVEVQVQGFELSAQILERLNTDLLVHDQLSAAVTSEEISRLVLSGPPIDALKDDLDQHALITAEKIQSLVLKQALPHSAEPDSSPTREKSIVLNENVTVLPHQYYPELLVIGGDVVLQGTVGILVVLGGDVQVLAGGRVISETVVLGGRLNVEPGGQVSPQQTILSSWKFVPWLRGQVESIWMGAWIPAILSFLGWLWAWLVIFTIERYAILFWAGAQKLWQDHKLASFGWGLALFLAWIPATAILTVSVIGLLLVPLLIGAFVLWTLVAYAVLLKFIANGFGATRTWALPWQVLLGQVIWMALGWIPFAGGLVRFLLLMISMGVVACALTPLRLTRLSAGSNN